MENLKEDLLVIIAQKIELSPLVFAIVDETVDVVMNSKTNDIPWIDLYPHDQLIRLALQRFVSSAKLLLLALIPDSVIVFRGVPLKDYYYRRDEWLSQLSLLNDSN